MCIEHPDHTGESANPDAPWNAEDALFECNMCGVQETEVDVGEDCTDENCDGTFEEVEVDN